MIYMDDKINDIDILYIGLFDFVFNKLNRNTYINNNNHYCLNWSTLFFVTQ